MLPEHLRQLPCVNVRYAGHLFLAEPLAKASCSIPMAVSVTVVTDNQSFHVYLAAFHEQRQSVGRVI
jgi:hypothetical protein